MRESGEVQPHGKSSLEQCRMPLESGELITQLYVLLRATGYEHPISHI